MTGWLLDTDVLSAFSPGRPALTANTAKWFADRSDELFLSTVTVTEIIRGIAKLHRLGATQRADAFAVWFDGIVTFYADRLLAFDLPAAKVAGELSDNASAIGRHPGFADIAIAATAKSHGLVVLTRNRRHFDPLGVEVLDPFDQI